MVKKKLLRDEIYKNIKKEIYDLKFEENFVITEKKLAEKYKVSKSPVREALHKLKLDGLVEVLPHKGYYIISISVDDLKDIFQARLVLEVGAVEIATHVATLDEITKLKEIVNISKETITSKSFIKYSELNYQFHLLIAKATKNKLIENIIEGLLLKLRRALYRDLQNVDFKNMKKQHLKIIDAIEKKDVSLAKKIMKKHLLDAKKRIFK